MTITTNTPGNAAIGYKSERQGPPRILSLDAVTVSQIAAGEVVERPASVLRELLDNALDSGATRISIEIEQGGIDRLVVVDNGTGILPDDLNLALASHATSKLQNAGDLEHITSMGFRGEALASIASVSRLSLQSHPHGQTVGAQLRSEGGILSDIEPWVGSPGTRVEVRHLFFNAPVRRRFLKSAGAEMAQLNETFIRFALSIASLPAEKRPHLAYRQGKKMLHDIPGDLPLLDRVGKLFGQEVANQLHSVDSTRGRARLTGLLADPACERATARLQYLFLNGRFLRDKSLTHAIQEAYRGLIMVGRQPVVFLHMAIPPEEVDVNVHPAKAEVRFRDSSAVHHLVFRGLRDRLERENLTARLTLPAANQFAPKPAPFSLTSPPLSAPVFPFPQSGTRIPASLPPPPPKVERYVSLAGGSAGRESNHTGFAIPSSINPIPTINYHTVDKPDLVTTQNPSEVQLSHVPGDQTCIEQEVSHSASSWKTKQILQIYNSFLLVEGDEGLLVIDQHALHERILYEQIKRRMHIDRLPTQRLLLPELVELSPEQAEAVEHWKKELAELGFEVEPFGGATHAITTYPAILGDKPLAPCFLATVEQIVGKSHPPTREQLLQGSMSLMACHSAVRAGDSLTPELMEALVEQRHLVQDIHHCPHGRPTVLVFSRQELERQFGRI